MFNKPISREDGFDIARSGRFRYGEAVVADVRLNQTTGASATVAGTFDDNSACKGALFLWRGHQYAVVTVDLKISIKEYSANLDMDERGIKLFAGVSCPCAVGHCVDEEIRYTFWDVINPHECDFEGYETLYNTNGTPDIYFSKASGNVQFGLAAAQWRI